MSQADPTEIEVNAFVRLFDTALRDLRTYLRRTLRKDDDAEDIAQEALLRVWGARGSLSMEAARPLLFRIASNLAIDKLREQQRWRFTEIAEADHETATVPADRVVAARQELDVIETAIRALPDKCRTAFILSRIDGHKHAEIAARMGISKSMVEKHVADAAFRLSQARLSLARTRAHRKRADAENGFAAEGNPAPFVVSDSKGT